MLAENPPGLGRLRKFIEFIGRPYKRVPNVGAEVPDVVAVAAAKAHADRMAMANLDVAKENLNLAYSALGDPQGENVTLEQIRAVLNAELEVLQASPSRPDNTSPFWYVNEDFLKQSLKLHTLGGLEYAEMFMFGKADFWRDIAHELEFEGINFKTEARRRVIACAKAGKLLDSAHIEFQRG